MGGEWRARDAREVLNITTDLCSQLKQSNLLIHKAETFLRNRQLCSHSRTSQHFMEPEGSTPRSQEPSTGSHHEPYQSNPHHPIVSKFHFNIVHPPTSSSS
jgi:hypothetical protein